MRRYALLDAMVEAHIEKAETVEEAKRWLLAGEVILEGITDKQWLIDVTQQPYYFAKLEQCEHEAFALMKEIKEHGTNVS